MPELFEPGESPGDNASQGSVGVDSDRQSPTADLSTPDAADNRPLARDYAGAVIESIRTPLVVLNMDLTIRTINSAFRSLSGLRTSDLEGRSFPGLAMLIWQLEDAQSRLAELTSDGNRPLNIEFQHEFEQASEKRFLNIWARTLLTDGGQVILVTFDDVSIRRRAELSEKRVKHELEVQIHSTEETLGRTPSELRALAGRLFTSQENERRRVARELHDDITQRLAHLQMQMEQIQRNPPENGDELASKLELLSQKTAALSNSVRDISHRLHPSILEDLGVVEAIRSLLDDFRARECMPVTFRQINVPESIPFETAAVLYRITQEALRNVAKHAGQTHVKILLEGHDSSLQLEIKDFGEGFDTQEKGAGLGLVSMAERARFVQGIFFIESELGTGTTVRVSVPISSDQERDV